MKNLPSEITITPNESNGAPYLGYEGGDGVVYVPRSAAIELYEVLEALTLNVDEGDFISTTRIDAAFTALNKAQWLMPNE